MIYGWYNSAAGMMVNEYRQGVLANNLANADTVGFKRDVAVFAERMPASIAGRRHGPSAAGLRTSRSKSADRSEATQCTAFPEASSPHGSNPCPVPTSATREPAGTKSATASSRLAPLPRSRPLASDAPGSKLPAVRATSSPPATTLTAVRPMPL